MRLAELVRDANAVAAASRRLEKTARLADLLRRVPADEIAVAVGFLSGQLRQGRLGIGHAAIAAAAPAASAEDASLELRGVDEALTAMAAVSGPGATRERVRQLAALLARATRDERDFLRRLRRYRADNTAAEADTIDTVRRIASTWLAAR